MLIPPIAVYDYKIGESKGEMRLFECVRIFDACHVSGVGVVLYFVVRMLAIFESSTSKITVFRSFLVWTYKTCYVGEYHCEQFVM